MNPVVSRGHAVALAASLSIGLLAFAMPAQAGTLTVVATAIIVVTAVFDVTAGIAATAITDLIASIVATIACASITPGRSSITGIGVTGGVVTDLAAGLDTVRDIAVATAAAIATGEQQPD